MRYIFLILIFFYPTSLFPYKITFGTKGPLGKGVIYSSGSYITSANSAEKPYGLLGYGNINFFSAIKSTIKTGKIYQVSPQFRMSGLDYLGIWDKTEIYTVTNTPYFRGNLHLKSIQISLDGKSFVIKGYINKMKLSPQIKDEKLNVIVRFPEAFFYLKVKSKKNILSVLNGITSQCEVEVENGAIWVEGWV